MSRGRRGRRESKPLDATRTLVALMVSSSYARLGAVLANIIGQVPGPPSRRAERKGARSATRTLDVGVQGLRVSGSAGWSSLRGGLPGVATLQRRSTLSSAVQACWQDALEPRSTQADVGSAFPEICWPVVTRVTGGGEGALMLRVVYKAGGGATGKLPGPRGLPARREQASEPSWRCGMRRRRYRMS
jgi:hypothetical protein